jgi:hypothetical protein
MLIGLTVADVVPVQTSLADSLFRQIPAGVGSKGAITLDAIDMAAMLSGATWNGSRRQARWRAPGPSISPTAPRNGSGAKWAV